MHMIDLHGQLCHHMISLARNVFRSLSIMFDYKSKNVKNLPNSIAIEPTITITEDKNGYSVFFTQNGDNVV